MLYWLLNIRNPKKEIAGEWLGGTLRKNIFGRTLGLVYGQYSARIYRSDMVSFHTGRKNDCHLKQISVKLKNLPNTTFLLFFHPSFEKKCNRYN
jgi:hypothetical protein